MPISDWGLGALKRHFENLCEPVYARKIREGLCGVDRLILEQGIKREENGEIYVGIPLGSGMRREIAAKVSDAHWLEEIDSAVNEAQYAGWRSRYQIFYERDPHFAPEPAFLYLRYAPHPEDILGMKRILEQQTTDQRQENGAAPPEHVLG